MKAGDDTMEEECDWAALLSQPIATLMSQTISGPSESRDDFEVIVVALILLHISDSHAYF